MLPGYKSKSISCQVDSVPSFFVLKFASQIIEQLGVNLYFISKLHRPNSCYNSSLVPSNGSPFISSGLNMVCLCLKSGNM